MEQNLKEVFIARLVEAMESAGVSQSELSRRIGCSREYVHYYVHGRMVPNFYRAYEISKALGVDLYWLMGVEENESEQEE
ncbi:MAG: helix-turn-helix transcriptional regulator [Clostridia bacterium]|nr:helix-turn-helix transcriptional regulator [Clostridia bacterium]